MERYINMAGSIVRILGPDADFHDDKGVLEDFEVEPQPWDWEMDIRLENVLPKPEGICVFEDAERCVYRNHDQYLSYIELLDRVPQNALMCVIREKNRSRVAVRRSVPTRVIYSRDLVKAMEAEHLIVKNRGILLHSSQIRYQDSAILFTAPSGIGKSTQAGLWKQYRGAEIINGDRSAVRITDTCVEAVGVPFCGSSNIRKFSVLPLKAVVYLSQAPQTTIVPVHGRNAFRMIWEGCSFHTWNREDVEMCMDTVMETLQKVPVYHLAARPDESSVEALEEILAERMR